jgi:8-oxo-dGTP pyrophosphatase MutT (NUDIX family)
MTKLSKMAITKAIEFYEHDHHRRYDILFSTDDLRWFRRAAVMIPLFENDDDWYVLLTQRSNALDEHRGQVAFPGGAKEEKDENLQWTALREMHEEIGIEPQDAQIFGYLGDIPIITKYIVRMFVGQIPWPYPLKISEDEVESVFTVPLRWLADQAHHTIRYRSIAGREFPVIYFDYFDGHQLWGASAEMTLALLTALRPIL